jgi:hypothetical protein
MESLILEGNTLYGGDNAHNEDSISTGTGAATEVSTVSGGLPANVGAGERDSSGRGHRWPGAGEKEELEEPDQAISALTTLPFTSVNRNLLPWNL